MPNETLKRLGGKIQAGGEAPFRAVKDEMEYSIQSKVRSVSDRINPLHIIGTIYAISAIYSIVKSIKNSYDQIKEENSIKDSDGNGKNDDDENEVKAIDEGFNANTKVLNLILDVLMETYRIQANQLGTLDRKNAIDKLKNLEKERENKTVFQEDDDKPKVVDDKKFSIFGMVMKLLPNWLLKTIGVGMVGGTAAVAGVASIFGFDEVLHAIEHLKTLFRALGRAILKLSKVQSLIKTVKDIGQVFKTIEIGLVSFFETTKGVHALFKPITGSIELIFSFMKGMTKGLAGLAGTFGKVFKYLGGPWITAFLVIFDFFPAFIKGFKEGGFIEGVKKGLWAVFEGFVLEPLNIIKSIVGWISGKLGFDNIKRILSSFDIKEVVNDFVDDFDIREYWHLFKTKMVETKDYLYGKMKDLFELGKSEVLSWIDKLSSYFKIEERLDTIKDYLGISIDNLKKSFKLIFSFEHWKSVIENFSIKDILQDFFTDLKDKIRDAFDIRNWNINWKFWEKAEEKPVIQQQNFKSFKDNNSSSEEANISALNSFVREKTKELINNTEKMESSSNKVLLKQETHHHHHGSKEKSSKNTSRSLPVDTETRKSHFNRFERLPTSAY